MALKIYLAKIGRKGKPKFRIAVTPARAKRGGKSVDILGFYDPSTNPPVLRLDQAKYEKWLKFGAQPSCGLRKILTLAKNQEK